MEIYRYLFYKFYKLAIALGNEDYYPEANALVLVSLCIWLNIESLFSIVEIWQKKELLGFISSMILVAGIIIANYFYFISKDKYLTYNKSFESEQSNKKILGWCAVLLYFLSSFGMFIYTSNILRDKVIR